VGWVLSPAPAEDVGSVYEVETTISALDSSRYIHSNESQLSTEFSPRPPFDDGAGRDDVSVGAGIFLLHTSTYFAKSDVSIWSDKKSDDNYSKTPAVTSKTFFLAAVLCQPARMSRLND
jgi:hypothetical protein